MRLPAFPQSWNVGDPHLLSDGIGGTVCRVTLPDGAFAAVKQASALAEPELDAACAYLQWADGLACARLIDRAGGLLLLEWAGGTTLRDVLDRDGDDRATEIAAETVSRLHRDRATRVPGGLMRLEDNFASLFRKASADRRENPGSRFVEAAVVARRLLDDQRDVRPLHGDVHHENILSSPRGWLAIDPKGLVGDPAFDIANLFYNPVDSGLRFSAARALSMAGILTGAFRCDIQKVLEYALAFSALSASWHLEDGNEAEAARSLAVGDAVWTALAQVRS